jgi:tetratricopeptide (TPR) repeat protein
MPQAAGVAAAKPAAWPLAPARGLACAMGLALGLATTVARAQESSSSAPPKGAAQAGAQRKFEFSRQRSALPQAAKPAALPTLANVNLQAVKPPRSGEFYDTGESKEAEYEHLVDQEISQLYALSQRYQKSRNRGELWLRLAERYVEKARLMGFRAQSEYDKKAKDYLQKKTRIKPTIDNRGQREYNKKAIDLYEWFVREFPEDKKIDQALFFLGYNWFEMGDTGRGENFYIQLTKRFPDSAYVVESYFALGEYYFENDRWQEALDYYAKVVARNMARLNTFALYKGAWCLYRLNRIPAALKNLEKVVRLGRGNEPTEKVDGRRAINKVRLGVEALRDYVPFYAEIGQWQNARGEFQRVSGSDAEAVKMLERLAYIFADSGKREAATGLFRQLISLNPVAEKAADYQYQIALTYQTADQRQYRHELDVWLESFGPDSPWSRENAKNAKLVEDTGRLQETTVRNFVLQLHQAAQNSHAQFSQQQAHAGYVTYAKHFPNAPKIVEMTFFHAELLFDMERREDAARLYTWVAEKQPTGPYAEKSLVNAMLALEKEVPSVKEIDERRGTITTPIALDPASERFEKAVLRYLAAKPKGEKASDAERRLGVLYYSYNQYDKAIDMFERILRDHPKSENAEIAGNLILDIYKLRGDMPGLVARGEKFLANPQTARSKFGQQVRTMLEKASYLNAEKLAEKKDYAKAAQEYEKFSKTNGSSELAEAARYKAAANYEKAGDVSSSIRMHSVVLATPMSDPRSKVIQNDSRNDVARLYSQTAQLESAARQYQSYAAANPTDPKAVNAYYNAGVLFDALGDREGAVHNYDAYYAKSNKSDRIEVVFLEAELHRKAGEAEKATRLYERYLREGGRAGDHVVQANYWIAKRAEQAGQAGKARAWYQKTFDANRATKQGVRYAAEARFRLAQDTLAQLAALRFRPSEKQQAQAAQQGETLRKKYLDEMKEVVRFDYAPYIVAALASTGQMFEYLAYAYSKVPAPPGYSPDDAKKLTDLAMGRATGFSTEAKNSYKAAYDKALELESYDEWTKMARAGLARYDAAAVGADAGEVAAEASAADWMGM